MEYVCVLEVLIHNKSPSSPMFGMCVWVWSVCVDVYLG